MGFVRSPLLQREKHGFSTREGGISTGRYRSLNVGGKWGDAAENVVENRRRLAAEAGFPVERLRTAHQVHGARCLAADGVDGKQLFDEDADALYAGQPGVVLGVYTADCVPILISDGKGRVAAAHAGWRGTLLGVASATVEALIGAGARRQELRVAIGPSIGPCCFEVGEDVAERFAAACAPSVSREKGPKPHVDLRRANRLFLEAAGLGPHQIDDDAPCTVCRADLFFSFRRDGGGIGQMLSFVVAGDGSSDGAR